MYTSTYLKNIYTLTLSKYLPTQGLVGLHGSLKTPVPAYPMGDREYSFPELAKTGPLLTHRSLSQNSWMQTRHVRPLSGLCAAREGAPLPGCRRSLRLWLFLHALRIGPTFSPYHPWATSMDLGFLCLSRASQQLPLSHRETHGIWGIQSLETEKYPCGLQGNPHAWKPGLFLFSLCLFGVVLSSFSFIIFCLFLRLLKGSCFVSTHKLS